MTIETTKLLAGLLILLSLVKLVVVVLKPDVWLAFARRVYSNPKLTATASLLSAGLILLLLMRSGLDIIQILAVCLFVVCLMIVGIAPYAADLMAWIEKQDVKRLIHRQWLYILVWMALLGWGTYALFAPI